MRQILIKPEVEQKTKWYILWWVVFLPIAVFLILLLMFFRYPESVGILTALIMFLAAALGTLFWIPAFHKSLLYEINEDSIISSKGVFWKIKSTIPISKIIDVYAKQGPLQRLFKMGNIYIQTVNQEGNPSAYPDIEFLDIRMFEEAKNEIMLRIKNIQPVLNANINSTQTEQTEKEILKNLIEEVKSIKKSIEEKQ